MESSVVNKTNGNQKLVIRALKHFKSIEQGDNILIAKRITKNRPKKMLRGEVIFKNNRMMTVKIKNCRESFTLADVIDKSVILKKEKVVDVDEIRNL